MHYTTKTAEEFIKKIKRGTNSNTPYSINERLKKFFIINNYTREKIKLFENAFNMSFPQFHNFTNHSHKIYINKILILLNIFSLFIYFKI